MPTPPSADSPLSASDSQPPPPIAPSAAPPLPRPSLHPTPTAGDVAEGEVAVSIYDFGFDPPLLKIKVGTTVTWTNTGAVEHTTVHFDNGKKTWDSDIMEPGDTYSFTFTKDGTYDYLCGLHPNMKATIEVID